MGCLREISLEVELAPSFAAPEPVHEHLDELVERGSLARTSRKEVVAALIASCNLDEEGLKTLIMGYRKANAADIPIDSPETS